MTTNDPPAKRPKTLSFRWHVFVPSISLQFQPCSTVFVRPTGATGRGKRVKLLEIGPKKSKVQVNDTTSDVKRKRLLPVYDTETTSTTVLVVASTTHYRQMAASQVTDQDRVLEMGCSTGETSALVWPTARSWVGLDTGADMVAATQSRMPNNIHGACHCVDALGGDPAVAEDCARSLGEPTVALVDIGGNRELSGVVRMLEWLWQGFGDLRLVIVKSEQAYKSLRTMLNDHASSDVITGANAWFTEQLAMAQRQSVPRHPLQAPKRYNPEDGTTPICRYHNYHRQGCSKAECPYDHGHCHWCLQAGHVARECPNVGKTKDIFPQRR